VGGPAPEPSDEARSRQATTNVDGTAFGGAPAVRRASLRHRVVNALPRCAVIVLTAVAFVGLHEWGLLGSTSLAIILPILLVGGLATEATFQYARHHGGYGPLIVVPLVVVTLVIYAIGWGPALSIGYLFPLGEAYKLEHPPTVRLSVGVILLGLGLGELAVALGIVRSHIPAGDGHALAALAALGLTFVLHMMASTSEKRRAAVRALAARESSFRQLFKQNPHPMWVYDEGSLAILAVNDAAVRSYGYGHDEWLGMRITDIRPDEDVSSLEENLRSPRDEYEESGVWRHRRADGSLIEVQITSHRTEYLGSAGVMVMAIDVTERNRLQRHLAYQTIHDDLTGLANRRQLSTRIAEQLAETRADGRALVLVSLDIDRFQELNAALGHDAGDGLLQRVAEDLCTLAPEALVARVGSDEFSVLFSSAWESAEVEARSLVDAALSLLSTPFHIGEAMLAVEASAGIAIGPATGSSTPMLAAVQEALARAKKSVARVEVNDLRSAPLRKPSLAVVGELRHAIERGDLRLHYQPKMALNTGQVVGFEALVRWQHPHRGLVSPDEFVPLAEQTGLVRPLAAFVVEQAAHQLAYWREMGFDLFLSVNLAAANLTDPDLPDVVVSALRDHACPPDRVTLEITESTVMVETERVNTVVQQLSDAGFELSIDDFGTANSSLARLRALPLSEIKLDKAFVCELDRRWEDATIVRSSINLAHDLGLRVVAEGVESAAVADMLRGWGCELAQGFWFSRPMDAFDATRWLMSKDVITGRRSRDLGENPPLRARGES
jgi:diguanylate cyclase (GGDEF)-like protein/PAS domain S-box-containing protein